MAAEVVQGEAWRGRNWSADSKGSIHDDATAGKLGFRGGTVAGNVHMDQFGPLLLRMFGERWFERGSISVRFHNATVDGESVRTFAEPLEPGAKQTRIWMKRDDGMDVLSGTASLDDHARSALRTLDLRPCDRSELRILRDVAPGLSLGKHDVRLSGEKQLERLDADWISGALDWYRDASPWGGAIATPSTAVELLWFHPTQTLMNHVGRAVGLFGAIEVAYEAGPLLLGERYSVSAEVISVGQSPKTEVLWFDSLACRPEGQPVARMRMMLRFMKASSALWQGGD